MTESEWQRAQREHAEQHDDMVPILEESIRLIREARKADAARKLAEAIARHPSGKDQIMDTVEATTGPVVPPQSLTLHDRCDQCGAAALYRLNKQTEVIPAELDFCGHHYFKNSPKMFDNGWSVVAVAPML